MQQYILDIKKQKGGVFFLLIDPDKTYDHPLLNEDTRSILQKVDIILIGGSILNDDNTDPIYSHIRKFSGDIPLLSFPGSASQLSKCADGILFTSLLSGRNPRFLVDEQVAAAPYIHKHQIPVIPTAYLLIDSGRETSVNRISDTQPLDNSQVDSIVAHALAGQYMGMQMIYLEAGSGADNTVSNEIISKVNLSIDIPIIAGGGIKTSEKAESFIDAGAVGIVVGNFAEKSSNIDIVSQIIDSVHGL